MNCSAHFDEHPVPTNHLRNKEGPAVDFYGSAQLIGDRACQCDATATYATDSGARAHVLLDGIGDNPAVRGWVQAAADRLAVLAAVHGDAETALRAERDRYAAEPDRHPDHGSLSLPAAAAVVAVHVPGGTLSVAWSGDARAYLLLDGALRLITDDHNERRAYDGRGDRHTITSCLGVTRSDEETEKRWGHPAVETVRGPARPGRLLLVSDGAYEPHEDADHGMADYLTGPPDAGAQRLVEDAVRRARAVPRARGRARADNATALVAVLDSPPVRPVPAAAGE
ncbi:hypothetical protein ACIOJ9_39445 [Streptomyces sp. NPDC088175]|uniref:hypothetical protein n=1 Tax=unclassified Streptomyces TaxID=2593676 RepID=UPI0037FA664D